MLFRPILSRLLKHQRYPDFWAGRNGASTLSNPKEKQLEKGYVISYLQNSCGLSSEKAIRASKFVHFDKPDKPNAVVSFLEKQGFTRSQIANVVAKFPKILIYDPEKSLLPKFEFYFSTGISESDIIKVLSKKPSLLERPFEHRVIPGYNYVKGVIGAEKAHDLLRRGSWVYTIDVEGRLKPNVEYLRAVGVPERFITFAFSNSVNYILFSDHVEFKRVVEEVRGMGFDPKKSQFISAMKARTGEACVALWNRSIEVYGKWGWTEDDINLALGTHPNCMVLSEKKISATLDFLVNKLGRESRQIARNLKVLSYSLEGRIVPRCSVVQLVCLEGLIEKEWSLLTVLCPPEDKFLAKFVTRYSDKMPHLYDFYLSKKASLTKSESLKVVIKHGLCGGEGKFWGRNL